MRFFDIYEDVELPEGWRLRSDDKIVDHEGNPRAQIVRTPDFVYTEVF
jgi:hypothetical protein